MAVVMTAMLVACSDNKKSNDENVTVEATSEESTIRINCMLTVDAANRDKAIDLCKQLVAASLGDEGVIDYDVLESATRPNKLMIFETWKDQASLDVHSAAAHFTRIVPQLANAAVGEMAIQSFTKASEGNQIRINCLFKVAAENVTKILGLSKELVEASRKDGGNIDYDIYQSQTDPTKMMIFETWQDQPSLDTHSAAEHFTRIVPQLAEAAVGEMAIQTFKK